MHPLKLRIPPPIVAAMIALLMWLVSQSVPAAEFVLPARRVLTACDAVAGVAIALAGVMAFRRVRSTVNPLQPAKASTLITSGV